VFGNEAEKNSVGRGGVGVGRTLDHGANATKKLLSVIFVHSNSKEDTFFVKSFFFVCCLCR